MKPDKKEKFLKAKPDVESAIRRHGLEAVRYVVNRHTEANRLERELARQKKRLSEELKAVEDKLKSSGLKIHRITAKKVTKSGVRL